MAKYLFTITVVCGVVFFSNLAQARVVTIELAFDSGPWQAMHDWYFDAQSQVFHVYDVFYEFGLVDGRIGGVVDSDSTFTVIRHITNLTDVTWTGAQSWAVGGVGGGGRFVDGSAESTKLQTITYPHPVRIELCEPPPVLPGESFTVQYEFFVPYYPEGGFLNGFQFVSTPEPATLLLVGVGALVLPRRRKA